MYSSAHTTDEVAQATLHQYIDQTGGPTGSATPRKLSFQPGYRREFWHKNCVAIGLSAGFIEPLEASALALVELSASMLSDEMPATRGAMDIVARRFNDAFTYRWERVIDFLKLHYVLSQRTDSDYWRDNRRTESIPQRLRELLVLGSTRAPHGTTSHGLMKCSRRRATSMFCMAWAFGRNSARPCGERIRRLLPLHIFRKRQL